MSSSPNPSDDSPLARLREAAARLSSGEGATAPSPPAAPRQPSSPPPAAPAPAVEAPWQPSWQPAAPPTQPRFVPPVPPPAGPEGRSRRPLIVGGVVAAVLVVVLVAVGLVAMSGDDDDSPAAAPTTTQVAPTTTVAPARERIPESRLYAPLTGYAFEALPEGMLEVARSPFEELPNLRGYLDDLSGRLVLRGGVNTAIVFVFQFNDRFLALPGGSDEFIDGITLVSSEVQPTTIAGLEGVYFVYGSSHAGVAVLDGNVAVLVQGPFSTPKSRLESLAASFLGRTG